MYFRKQLNEHFLKARIIYNIFNIYVVTRKKIKLLKCMIGLVKSCVTSVIKFYECLWFT